MNETVILPQPQVMLYRLMQVAYTLSLRRHFYPLLLAHAGTVQTAEGVVQILNDAIATYATRKTDQVRLTVQILGFVEALVPNRKVAREVIMILMEPKKRAMEVA